MGFSTFLIGLVPSFSSWGYGAPLAVLTLRLIQGLALGGEYGGAANLCRRACPNDKAPGLYQLDELTATLGFLSLGVIVFYQGLPVSIHSTIGVGGYHSGFYFIGCHFDLHSFKDERVTGFCKIKAEGAVSKNPLKKVFNKANFKMVLLALFWNRYGAGVV